MNVIARLEYELAYYDSAVHRFNHYTTRTTLDEDTCWGWCYISAEMQLAYSEAPVKWASNFLSTSPLSMQGLRKSSFVVEFNTRNIYSSKFCVNWITFLKLIKNIVWISAVVFFCDGLKYYPWDKFSVSEKKKKKKIVPSEYGGCCTFSILCFAKICLENIGNFSWRRG